MRYHIDILRETLGGAQTLERFRDVLAGRAERSVLLHCHLVCDGVCFRLRDPIVRVDGCFSWSEQLQTRVGPSERVVVVDPRGHIRIHIPGVEINFWGHTRTNALLTARGKSS